MFKDEFGKNVMGRQNTKGWYTMSKRKDLDTKSTLTTTQEVLYSHEFKRADKAGGYTDGNKRRK